MDENLLTCVQTWSVNFLGIPNVSFKPYHFSTDIQTKQWFAVTVSSEATFHWVSINVITGLC